MNERQHRFCEAYPDAHLDVRRLFPDFDYRNPAPGAITDMRDPKNCTGYQQKAFSVWHAIEKCGPLDMGLDLGAPKGLTPFCTHVDLFGGGETHPVYGLVGYTSDLIWDASRIHEIVPAASVPFINANHSLEHMPPADDDGAIVELLRRWLGLLRVGGVLAMILPDNDLFDARGCDKDHKHAWGHSDFPRRILNPLFAQGGCRLVDFNTLNNFFSFDVVLERVG